MPSATSVNHFRSFQCVQSVVAQSAWVLTVSYHILGRMQSVRSDFCDVLWNQYIDYFGSHLIRLLMLAVVVTAIPLVVIHVHEEGYHRKEFEHMAHCSLKEMNPFSGSFFRAFLKLSVLFRKYNCCISWLPTGVVCVLHGLPFSITNFLLYRHELGGCNM